MLDRAAKWSRRHKAAVATAAVLLVLAVVGLAASTVLVGRERDEARRQRERAEVNFRKARDAVDRMFTRASRDLANIPRMEQIRRAMLEDALEFYQGFLKEKSQDRRVRHEAALAYMQVGRIYQALGRGDRAEAPCLRALALLRGLSADFPDVPQFRMDHADCLLELAGIHKWEERSRQSIEERREALAIHEKLAADFPKVPDFVRALAMAHSGMATQLSNGADRNLDEAETHFRRALAFWRKQEEDFPDAPADQVNLSYLLQMWGVLLRDTGRHAEAEAAYRRALAIREGLAAKAPANPRSQFQLEHIKSYLGDLLLRLEKYEEAERYFREALAICETLRDDFPDVADYSRRLGVEFMYLSQVLRARGRGPDAEVALRRCVAIRQALVAKHPDVYPHPQELAMAREELGRHLHESGHPAEAAKEFRQALEFYEKAAAEHPDTARHQNDLSRILSNCPAPEIRDPARAVTMAERAVRLAPADGFHRLVLGVAHSRAGNWRAAIASLEEGMKLRQGRDGGTYFSLAEAHMHLDNKVQARLWYDRGKDWIAKRNPRDAQMRRAHAQAAAALGLEDDLMPSGRDVPTRKIEESKKTP